MKSLVIGASGLVGREIHAQLSNGNYPVVGTGRQINTDKALAYLDIKDRDEVFYLIEKIVPDVIYLAAYESWVDWCETHPGESAETNVDGCYNVIDAASKVGAIVVFFSSSYVFSGRGLNTVTTIRNPLNVYGAQKVLVEDYIMENCANFFLVRTVGVFGDERKNFFGQVRNKLMSGEEIFAPDDQFMNPIWVVDLVRKTLDIVMSEKHHHGIYHIAGDTVLSKYQFAKRIIRELNGSMSLVKRADNEKGAARPARGELYCNPLIVFPANFSRSLRRLING